MTLTVTHVLVYKDRAEEWRWQARAENGRVVADSGEGYEHRQHAIDAATELYPQAEVEEGDE